MITNSGCPFESLRAMSLMKSLNPLKGSVAAALRQGHPWSLLHHFAVLIGTMGFSRQNTQPDSHPRIHSRVEY